MAGETTSGVAKRWLEQPRSTWGTGTEDPTEPNNVSLRESYDALIHLYEVSAAGTFL